MGAFVFYASAGDDPVRAGLEVRGLLHWIFVVSLIAAQFWMSASMGQVGLIRIGSVLFLGLLPLVLCLWPLGIGLSDLGFGRPQNLRKIRRVFFLVALVSPALILIGMKMSGTSSYYGKIFSDQDSHLEKLRDLGSFVLVSTLLLEFFFRSFLFMGHRRFSKARPWFRAILVVAGEMIVHMKKPVEEIAGVGVLSTILCWMTHRTQSVWPAFILHLWIEVWFVLSFF
jgi:membrane protease YdiL (CAAX protease family)